MFLDTERCKFCGKVSLEQKVIGERGFLYNLHEVYFNLLPVLKSNHLIQKKEKEGN